MGCVGCIVNVHVNCASCSQKLHLTPLCKQTPPPRVLQLDKSIDTSVNKIRLEGAINLSHHVVQRCAQAQDSWSKLVCIPGSEDASSVPLYNLIHIYLL